MQRIALTLHGMDPLFILISYFSTHEIKELMRSKPTLSSQYPCAERLSSWKGLTGPGPPDQFWDSLGTSAWICHITVQPCDPCYTTLALTIGPSFGLLYRLVLATHNYDGSDLRCIWIHSVINSGIKLGKYSRTGKLEGCSGKCNFESSEKYLSAFGSTTLKYIGAGSDTCICFPHRLNSTYQNGQLGLPIGFWHAIQSAPGC